MPSFGPIDARLAIVGLAPGLKGANRTGRPFTGDYAGSLLYDTLIACGFARGVYRQEPDDGLELIDCRIVNAVRCVPPANKPLPQEIATCNQFLAAEIAQLPNLTAIVALGRIAHEATLRALGMRKSAFRFAHGAVHELKRFALFDSYHCSRQNTNTGVLTSAMFRAVFESAKNRLHLPRCSNEKSQGRSHYDEFVSLILPRVRPEFVCEHSFFADGDFGDLNQIQFVSKDIALNLEFWSSGVIFYEAVNVSTGDWELYPKAFLAGEITDLTSALEPVLTLIRSTTDS